MVTLRHHDRGGWHIGVPTLAAVAAFPAVSALIVLPTYPTLLAVRHRISRATTARPNQRTHRSARLSVAEDTVSVRRGHRRFWVRRYNCP